MKDLNELKKEFFNRKSDVVARELIGKIIVRIIAGKDFIGKIVETEAYFDYCDPASRACKNGDLKNTMEMDAGTILVFGVHNNWLLNFVTDEKDVASAVLIRAIEPINFNLECNGPGKLTKALKIGKELHKKNLFNNHELSVLENLEKHEIETSFRIGVTRDLNEHYRYYIKGSRFVSR